MERKLTRNGTNYIVLIDDEDVSKIYGYGLGIKIDKNGRIAAVTMVNRKTPTQYLHRFILSITDKNIEVDHINRNPLDNRKCNLRICTPKNNKRNRTSQKNSTSEYLGVSKITNYNKYSAIICVDYKTICLGTFSNEYDAAKRYDSAAAYYFKEFAGLNFSDESLLPYLPDNVLIDETLKDERFNDIYFNTQQVKDILIEKFGSIYPISHYIKNKIKIRLLELCDGGNAIITKSHYKSEKFKLV